MFGRAAPAAETLPFLTAQQSAPAHWPSAPHSGLSRYWGSREGRSSRKCCGSCSASQSGTSAAACSAQASKNAFAVNFSPPPRKDVVNIPLCEGVETALPPPISRIWPSFLLQESQPCFYLTQTLPCLFFAAFFIDPAAAPRTVMQYGICGPPDCVHCVQFFLHPVHFMFSHLLFILCVCSHVRTCACLVAF